MNTYNDVHVYELKTVQECRYLSTRVLLWTEQGEYDYPWWYTPTAEHTQTQRYM